MSYAMPVSRLGYAIHHARRGRRVLVVVQLQAQIRSLVLYLDAQRRDGERTGFATGAEAFRPPGGGEVLFTTTRGLSSARFRGQSFDLILLAASVVTDADAEEALKLLTSDSSIAEEYPPVLRGES